MWYRSDELDRIFSFQYAVEEKRISAMMRCLMGLCALCILVALLPFVIWLWAQ